MKKCLNTKEIPREVKEMLPEIDSILLVRKL